MSLYDENVSSGSPKTPFFAQKEVFLSAESETVARAYAIHEGVPMAVMVSLYDTY